MVFQVLICFNKNNKPLLVAEDETTFQNTTILDLKKKLKIKIPGAPDPDDVRVIFGKYPLEDNRTLSHYNIKHLSLLLIVLKMPGGDVCSCKHGS
ncbi:ubiquitin-like [Sinocyclocheilus grahami]|uniref:ubiquitin-like n=1 Tax=Sinocyclocheilus grahami TaxID=75366 RepID=UPI0007AC8688|nr:PREDICTED: ubiquitin-like [Sinocyclocheilus grahami]